MRPEATLPIDTAGRLAIRSPGGVDLFLEARGARLQVDVGTLGDLLRLRRDMRGGPGIWSKVETAAVASRIADLDCVVRLRRREIGRIGPRTRPNWLGRLLGVAPVRIDWRALLTSLVVRDR